MPVDRLLQWVLGVRVVAGSIFLALAALGWTVFSWSPTLNASLAAMVLFILAETGASYWWAYPYIEARQPEPEPAQSAPAVGNAYADAAKVAITTQGFVLGLIAFQGSGLPNATVKAGASALVIGVLSAAILYLNVAPGSPPDRNRRFAASMLFTLVFWSLGFGLICVVAGTWG